MAAWRIRNVIIVLLSIALILTLHSVIPMYFSNRWEPKAYRTIEIIVNENSSTLTKAEARKIVSSLYNEQHFYKEKDIKQFGRVSLFFRSITINCDLEIDDYIYTYAHELTHLKYWCRNEVYTEFKTFTTLYESGNDELKNIALKRAKQIMEGNVASEEYDCGYYIVEYLRGENKYE